MATHVRVLRKANRDLLFDKVYPEDVPSELALKNVASYVEMEGLNHMYPLVQQYCTTVDYKKFVSDYPILWGSDGTDGVHIVWENKLSYCGVNLDTTISSDVKYADACEECVLKAGL